MRFNCFHESPRYSDGLTKHRYILTTPLYFGSFLTLMDSQLIWLLSMSYFFQSQTALPWWGHRYSKEHHLILSSLESVDTALLEFCCSVKIFFDLHSGYWIFSRIEDGSFIVEAISIRSTEELVLQ